MKRRGDIVKVELANELREFLPSLQERIGVDDLDVQGRDGAGSRTEVPWTRVYSRSRSPRATGGWYLVFLFSADGERAYLSLNQGPHDGTAGGWHPQPPSEISARADWARSVLTATAPFPPRWTTDIRLNNRVSELGTLYERGNVVAVEYPSTTFPAMSRSGRPLNGRSWLGEVYRHSGDGSRGTGQLTSGDYDTPDLDLPGQPSCKYDLLDYLRQAIHTVRLDRRHGRLHQHVRADRRGRHCPPLVRRRCCRHLCHRNSLGPIFQEIGSHGSGPTPRRRARQSDTGSITYCSRIPSCDAT